MRLWLFAVLLSSLTSALDVTITRFFASSGGAIIDSGLIYVQESVEFSLSVTVNFQQSALLQVCLEKRFEPCQLFSCPQVRGLGCTEILSLCDMPPCREELTFPFLSVEAFTNVSVFAEVNKQFQSAPIRITSYRYHAPHHNFMPLSCFSDHSFALRNSQSAILYAGRNKLFQGSFEAHCQPRVPTMYVYDQEPTDAPSALSTPIFFDFLPKSSAQFQRVLSNLEKEGTIYIALVADGWTQCSVTFHCGVEQMTAAEIGKQDSWWSVALQILIFFGEVLG